MNRESEQPLGGPPADDTELDEGGDPVCWAHLVCPECGVLNATRNRRQCEGCGTTFPNLYDGW
jgi:hypothetical protein